MKTNGLPPSRLMERHNLGPGSPGGLGEVKRNLSNEFEFLAGSRAVNDTGPALPSHEPVIPVMMPGQVVPPHPQLVPMSGWSEARPEGGIGPDVGQSVPRVIIGSDSGFLNQPSLPSTTHSSVDLKTSDPVLVYQQPQYIPQTLAQSPLMMPQSPHMMTQPLNLPQSMYQFPTLLPQPQPVPPGGRPAYCFHCLQYGAVFSINPI